jgi:hypothetical protein
MSKGYERWHYRVGREPDLTRVLYQDLPGAERAQLALVLCSVSDSGSRERVVVLPWYVRAAPLPARFFSDDAATLVLVRSRRERRRAMRTGGCDQLRETERITDAWASTASAGSPPASHRSHCEGQVVR